MRPIESDLSATMSYCTKNIFHAVAEMLNALFCMILPQNCMFRDMTPALDFFRWKSYPILAPKMLFSDFPSFKHSRTTQEKNTKKVVSPGIHSLACVYYFFLFLSAFILNQESMYPEK